MTNTLAYTIYSPDTVLVRNMNYCVDKMTNTLAYTIYSPDTVLVRNMNYCVDKMTEHTSIHYLLT
jgi:hypothetical protein